jgi:hypothetical protein
MKRILAIALWIAFLAGSSHGDWCGEATPSMNLSLSVMEVFDRPHEPGWGIEYRGAFRFCCFGPWIGVSRDYESATYAAVGFFIDLRLGDRWAVTPSFGGGYFAAHGFDLGSVLEFRSAIECSYRFNSGDRLGIGIGHISNGGISDRNPGTELAFLFYSFALTPSR